MQMREERMQAVEDHVQTVKKLLNEAQQAGQGGNKIAGERSDEEKEEEEEEWGGIRDEAVPAILNHEEGYIDEDRYTTVTIESVHVDRDGLHKPEPDSEDQNENQGGNDESNKSKIDDTGVSKARRGWPKRRKKFRYETKFERRVTQKAAKAAMKHHAKI
jgi:ribosomal RNA-processing protein 17